MAERRRQRAAKEIARIAELPKIAGIENQSLPLMNRRSSSILIRLIRVYPW